MHKIDPAVLNGEVLGRFLRFGLAQKKQVAAIVEFPDQRSAGNWASLVIGDPGASLPNPVALTTSEPAGSEFKNGVRSSWFSHQVALKRNARIPRRVEFLQMIKARSAAIGYMDLRRSILSMTRLDQVPSQRNRGTASPQNIHFSPSFFPMIGGQESLQTEAAADRIDGPAM